MPSESLVKYADVETSSDAYAQRFSGSVGEYLLDVQGQLLVKHLALIERFQQRPIVKILDFGGGHAQIAKALLRDLHLSQRMQLEILGSDSSCQRQLEKSGLSTQVHFTVDDLTHTHYVDQEFDVVTSIRLISHFEPWQELVRELCRVAKRGVVIDYPPLVSTNFFYPLLFALKRRLEGNTRTFTVFSHREMDAAFAANGFRRLKRSGQFWLPMVVHRKLKSPAISKCIESLGGLLGLRYLIGNPVLATYVRETV